MLMAQLQYLSAQCVWIKYKEIIVWRTFLRYRLDYFLGHNTTDDCADRTDLRVQVTSVIVQIHHTL